MKTFKNLDETASYVLSLVEGDLKIATPLGLGKANQLVNKIYEHFKNSSFNRNLEIYTALSLDTPVYKSRLEQKLLEPFVKRHFGNYPKLRYVQDLQQNKIPAHIRIHEFYFMAGQFLGISKAQQNYISLNYTYAAKGLADRGLQVIIQIIAKGSATTSHPYSLSCNPDMTLDLYDLYQKRNKKLFIIGVVHPDLPFLDGDAAVNEDFFDAILESPEIDHQLFALPRNPVDAVDHMIGMHAAQLIQDDGTLQIGIGSLSDALIYSTLLRHQNNHQYLAITGDFWGSRKKPDASLLHDNPFAKGLYATSEMLMDGFMHLRKARILKRFVFDQDLKKNLYLHAAFFLGSKELYKWLRDLKGEDYDGLSMTRVSKVNDLYDSHEMALRHQRKNARFFNTCMQVNLLGSANSDTLDEGQVISGVGGQYNFVAMSQELDDSRSILMLRSTRTKGGKRYSNIVTTNGQVTIPRHLRDMIVTEYGIANLKGKSDNEVIQSLIEITDSKFQQRLIRWAQKNKKLNRDYVLPPWASKNTPEEINGFINKYQKQNIFPEDPFGLDFTKTEFKLIKALTLLKQKSKLNIIGLLIKCLFVSSKAYAEELRHLKLDNVRGLKDFYERLIVVSALSSK